MRKKLEKNDDKAETSEDASKIEEKAALNEEIEATVSQSNVQGEKKKLRKKQMKQGGGALIVLLLIYGIHLGLKPFEGTMAYGICKVFLELNVRYPNTLRISTVEEMGASVRIWYTQTDSFGAYRMEPIQCYYKADEKLGFILDKITIRRKELDPEIIDRFNAILPVIFANPPDLIYPAPLADSLEGLQFETDSFRMPIL